MTWLSIVLVVLGNVVYHLGQRKIPAEANPVVFLNEHLTPSRIGGIGRCLLGLWLVTRPA